MQNVRREVLGLTGGAEMKENMEKSVDKRSCKSGDSLCI